MALLSEYTHKPWYRPVIPLVFAFISGIALGEKFPGKIIFAWLVAGLCFIAIINSVFKKKNSKIILLILLASLGYISINPWISPSFPKNHIVRFIDKTENLTGIVKTLPYKKGSLFSFYMEMKNAGKNNIPVSGLLKVTGKYGCENLTIGDTISFKGKIRAIRNFNNPGAFDYKRYMAFKGIFAKTYIRKGTLEILERHKSHGIKEHIEKFREKAGKIIKATGAEHYAILKAVLTGDKHEISGFTREQFARAGIAHILAISGLHLGIVATVFYFIFRWIFSRFGFILWSGHIKKAAALFAICPVAGYAVISGMSPSTQRALIMIILFFVSFWVEREPDLINILAWAAMIILIIHPPSLFSISFQLSFGAVLSILLGMSANNAPVNKQPGIFSKILIFIKVSFFAIMGTIPITMHYFNRFSLNGLVSNLVFVPLIGFIVIPLGLVSIFILLFSLPFSAFFAGFGINLSARLLDLILRLLPFFANLPFTWQTITPNMIEAGSYYIAGFIVLLWLKSRPPLENRAKTKLAYGLCLIFMVMICDISYWIYERFLNPYLKVTIIDVGQGSSALIEFPYGKTMLIDGGGFYDNSVFDMGARVVGPFLWHKKIKSVDTLILSHPDGDHLNGLLYIAENFNVKKVITNGIGKNSEEYEKFVEIIDKKKIKWPDFSNIKRTAFINGAKLEILYPPENIKEIFLKNHPDHNNICLVVKIGMGDVDFLFPGDMEKQGEKELCLLAGKKLKTRFLIGPHHGSKTSSTKKFLDLVDPQYVLISAGWKNRFHCPHPLVLKRYEKRGCAIFRTDFNGAIRIATDGKKIKIRVFARPDKKM